MTEGHVSKLDRICDTVLFFFSVGFTAVCIYATFLIFVYGSILIGLCWAGMDYFLIVGVAQSALTIWGAIGILQGGEPNRFGLFLLALVTPSNVREGVLGDAQEGFSRHVDHFGKQGATVLFWWDVTISSIRFVSDALYKPIWAFLAWLGMHMF
jgi:hypothetical protein